MTMRTTCTFLVLALLAPLAIGQVSGNISYGGGGGKARAEAQERAAHTLTKEDLPPDNSMFLEANVLLNVRADEYVAVFAVSRDGATIGEANERVNAAITKFTDGLRALHIPPADIFVDYIAAPKVYGYDVTENVARERLAGFELKKNVSVRYSHHDMLDRVLAAAADAEIYDLIKVDYVLKDVAAMRATLMTEASAVVRDKLARDQKLLGVNVKSSPTVYAERSNVIYPSELYDSYTAAESESLQRPPNLQRLAIQNARKSRTFFFNPLDAGTFDRVINPSVLEPVVQCTLYLKLKYEVVH